MHFYHTDFQKTITGACKYENKHYLCFFIILKDKTPASMNADSLNDWVLQSRLVETSSISKRKKACEFIVKKVK